MFHIWLQRPLCPSFSVVCVFPGQKTGLMGLSQTNTQSEQWQAVRSAVSPNYRRCTAEIGGSRGPNAGSPRGTEDLLSDKLSAFNKSDNCLTLQKAWRFVIMVLQHPSVCWYAGTVTADVWSLRQNAERQKKKQKKKLADFSLVLWHEKRAGKAALAQTVRWKDVYSRSNLCRSRSSDSPRDRHVHRFFLWRRSCRSNLHPTTEESYCLLSYQPPDAYPPPSGDLSSVQTHHRLT